MCQCGGKHAHRASISFYTHGLYRRQCGGENAKHDVTHTKTNEARKRVATSTLPLAMALCTVFACDHFTAATIPFSFLIL